ncbi:hypothetical protein E4U34_002808 [Claviceps purpurea]|nr:hypothetical protein E4U34_002808 [Claviceps purpurea]
MSHEPRFDRSTTASKHQGKNFHCPVRAKANSTVDMAERMIKASREGGQVGDDDDQEHEYEDEHKDELLDTMAREGTGNQEDEEDVGDAS